MHFDSSFDLRARNAFLVKYAIFPGTSISDTKIELSTAGLDGRNALEKIAQTWAESVAFDDSLATCFCISRRTRLIYVLFGSDIPQTLPAAVGLADDTTSRPCGC